MNVNKSFWISLVFVFFVFVVAIVLLNLLNALAISDTQKIIEDGEIADLSMKVQVLHKYEKFVAKDETSFSKLIHKWIKVFDENTTGKVLIDIVEGKIRLLNHSSSYKELPKKAFFFMDSGIVKNLQDLVNKCREDEAKIIKKREFRDRIRNIESIQKNIKISLEQVSQKLNI
jgi:hypothetical protein